MEDNLTNKILISMPMMHDTRFERTIVYVCVHSNEGAMGLILNKSIDDLSFPDLLQQLNLNETLTDDMPEIDLKFGGPVEMGRGFVLHSADYKVGDSTLEVSEHLSLTGTIDILKDIAQGHGPEKSVLALGYAGWSEGQLEHEFRENGWLHCTPDDELIFGTRQTGKWEAALRKIGVEPQFLAAISGRA